jgi:hypothetical protein
MDELTPDQVKVLFEFVEYAKREPKFLVTAPKEAMIYDFAHGDGEAIELLNDCFYELIKVEKLSLAEIKELAITLAEREIEYTAEELDDIFHPERKGLNEIRMENRRKKKTNGLEYLR